jgi:hypothetical protein
MRRFWLCLSVGALVTPWLFGQSADAPTHGRPFFMPATERERLHTLIKNEKWAAADYDRMRAAAKKGDGFSAAFLYALDGDAEYVAAARKELLARYGPSSFAFKLASSALSDPKHFKGGPKNENILYYDLAYQPLLAFDWVYNGLDPADRKTIEDGILAWARYKMRAMDAWVQTPNLVFKPTWFVALVGLATADKECLEWGFRRRRPWGPTRGGYFEVLDSMLLDGGPWHEAAIYPVAHEDLWCMGVLSWYRRLYDGKDWFAYRTPNGGSAKGLMDYYLDTAYPIEKTGFGAGQVRVATYGDGATNAKGDLFLTNPAGEEGGDWVLDKALSAAYLASADTRYAAFLAMDPGYKPTLVDRRPLPEKLTFPAAPSKVWPNYGLAMLRSDESAGYWTNPKAIAVFQVMTRGYGHDHRDGFHISLHGANRLMYPDYNPIQYETQAIGWTRNTVAHNTMLVDEQDTANSPPTGIRQEFSPEVKFLATTATGVFEGVEQTRALCLTAEYLLDIFQAASKVPHTYDYMLHCFGDARPGHPERFKPSAELTKRYWLVEKQRTTHTDESWSLDFVRREEPGFHKGKYGKEWYDHVAKVRVTMAAEPGTVVGHGVWGDELARLVAERQKGARLDKLSTLMVRRDGARDTAFIASHEPYANDEQPRIKAVRKIARTPEAVLVRVDAKDFTDYVAVAFGPQKDAKEHVLGKAGEAVVAFHNYAHVRVDSKGVTARGGLTALAIPSAKGPLQLNGKPTALSSLKAAPKKELPAPAEFPGKIRVTPSVLRVFDTDRREAVFTITNPLEQALSGKIHFELPKGVTAEPARPAIPSVPPGGTAEVRVTLKSNNAAAGRVTIPYQIHYSLAGKASETVAGALALVMAVGPTMELQYQHPKPAVFLLQSRNLTAKLRAFDGLCEYLADDDDTVRLDDSPLFTLGDEKGEILSDKADTQHAATWPRMIPAALEAMAGRGPSPLCRWQLLPLGNRLMVRMDRIHAQFERAYFTIPGKWISPGGPPRWKRVVAFNDAGKEIESGTEGKGKVSAAELEFPGGKWNLAFHFVPPQPVEFRGAGMRFSVGALNGDNWQVGFCRPGELDAWRGKK